MHLIKFFLFFLSIVSLMSCSFDNKSGIWSSNIKQTKQIERFEDFETIFTDQQTFNSIIKAPNNLEISIEAIIKNKKWLDEYYQNSNNTKNFSYKNIQNIVFKSKKIIKTEVKDKILFDKGNLITINKRGLLHVYSIEKKKIIYQYNFYKDKFKKIKKNINFIVENDIIYLSDNLGFFYALDYKSDKIIWAKNFKVPFRSNIKISENKIITSDQNNTLIILNRLNGQILRKIPTEETPLKNRYVNSLALSENSIFFLNTYGSLYSLNKNDLRINWFININQSLETDKNNLFYSNPIVISKNKIILSTDPYLYVIDTVNGSTLSKNPVTSIVTPIVSENNIFLITKDNLLINYNLDSKKILYSLDIIQEVASFLDSRKKNINIKYFFLVNDEIFIFLDNSYVIKFNINGSLKEIFKFPSTLKTSPIFIEDLILYLNKSNKLIILN